MNVNDVLPYLDQEVEQIDFIDKNIGKVAENLYKKYNRDFAYFFKPSGTNFIFRPLLGIIKVFGTFVMMFTPGISNFEQWGLSGSIYYRKEKKFVNKLKDALNIFPNIKSDELPLFVYLTSGNDSFLITDKTFYYKLKPSANAKVQIKGEAKNGQITLREIKQAYVKYKKMTNSANIYIDNEHVGGFLMWGSKDGIVLNDFMQCITK